jgi:heptosyltransferase-2
MSLIKLSNDLREFHFDYAFALHASPTSAWLTRLAQAKTTLMHNHNFNGKDFFSLLPIKNREHLHPATRRDALCLQTLGFETSAELKTKLCISIDQKNWLEIFKKNHQLQKPLLTLALGASRPAKIWPIEYYAQLAEMWIERKKGSVILLTSNKEKLLVDNFFKHFKQDKKNILACYEFSLEQSTAVISISDVFCGNDSGPKHIAVALDIPTLSFFGPEDPFEYHPYPTNKHPYLYIENLNCRTNLSPQGDHPWCGLYDCKIEKLKCLTNITPTMAWSYIEKIV